MKKSLFLIFTVLSIFLIADNVYAYTLGTAPSTYGEYYQSGVGSGATITTSQWPSQISADYNNHFTSQWIDYADYGYIWYDFGNIGYCEGKNFIISGDIKFRNPHSMSKFTSFSAYMYDESELISCSFYNTSSGQATYSCSGKGGGILKFWIYYEGAYNSTDILLNRNVNITCEATNNDIISNQNNNASAIIGAGVANSQNIINNQNQNQQQTNEKLDNLNDSLTNSKVEGGTGSSFFNDFKTNDNGGISSIITAPLVAINSMLDNTCSPMSVTYKGKEVSLPCGTEFWAKATTIQDYLNWFEGGILVYLIIRKLYKLIESMKNPDDDRVEVMDL